MQQYLLVDSKYFLLHTLQTSSCLELNNVKAKYVNESIKPSDTTKTETLSLHFKIKKVDNKNERF